MRIGHHGRAAFLAAHRDLDIGIVQAVQHRQIAFAGDTKDMFDAMGDQLVDQNVTAKAGILLGHGGVVVSLG
ncbi:hypothetical protein D3C81_2277830 [compost metagenome]